MHDKYDKQYASSRRTKTLGEIINFIESTVTKICCLIKARVSGDA